jgi:uncharacterized metal-binding protein YceD (DUF177 family)
MKIKIKDIKPEGIDIDYQINANEVGLSDREYLYLVEPLSVKAHIERIEDTVLVKGTVNSRYHSFCSRTLTPVERGWSAAFLLDFAIGKSTEYIEPDEDIRQEVILGLPVKVLCDEELKKEKSSSQKLSDDEMKEPSAEGKSYQPFADLKLKKD